MLWHEIDPKNLPEQEVLAACFKPYTNNYKDKMIGFLYEENGQIYCQSKDGTVLVLDDCTHYVDINKFDL